MRKICHDRSFPLPVAPWLRSAYASLFSPPGCHSFLFVTRNEYPQRWWFYSNDLGVEPSMKPPKSVVSEVTPGVFEQRRLPIEPRRNPRGLNQMSFLGSLRTITNPPPLKLGRLQEASRPSNPLRDLRPLPAFHPRRPSRSLHCPSGSIGAPEV